MAKRRSADIPFLNGAPISEADVHRWSGGEDDELERIDGPAPAGSANTGGGKRRFKSDHERAADILRLIRVATDEDIWALVDEMERSCREPHRPDPSRGYNMMDIVVMEAATHLHFNREHVLRNLTDQWYWDRLRTAVAKRFPKARYPNWEARRLSPTAPSRHQWYRARCLISGGTLQGLLKGYRRVALGDAVEIGLLDPDKPKTSWTTLDRSQIVVGDSTWMHAATRFHRDDPPAKRTRDGKRTKAGELYRRRHDENAEYFNTRDKGRSEVPGRALRVLSVRGDHANHRIILDAEFARHADDPDRLNESDHVVAMLKRLIDENTTDDGTRNLTDGIKGFGYDMALDSESIDDVLDLRRVPVVKVPRLARGRFRNNALGLHKFTTRTGNIEEIAVNTLNGSPWIWLPEGAYGKLQAVPLVRKKLQWGRQGQGQNLLYMKAAIPIREDVPEPLQGATTWIRMNSTPEEIANKPKHTRRTRSLRPNPEADPHFVEVRGAREDIESTFSNLKYVTRGRLPSCHENQNLFNIVAYAILRMTQARAAYYNNVAANPSQAIPIAA